MCFSELLEENAFRTSDRGHMSNLIPFVLQEEQAQIKIEINGKYISVIFDGTTRTRKALAVVLCFVDEEEWVMKQCLTCLLNQPLAKSGKRLLESLLAYSLSITVLN